jgi:hypothetical protein
MALPYLFMAKTRIDASEDIGASSIAESEVESLPVEDAELRALSDTR